jgi:hypothetical protein
MSRVRILNDLINSIDSEAAANKLVKTWLPHQAHGIDHGSFGCKPGVQNCSLIAEFIITYINVGVVDYSRLLQSAPIEVPFPFAALPFSENSGTDAMHAGAQGHEMAILREGNTYALFHAWEDDFHVFPRLNRRAVSFNVMGDGPVAVAEIGKMITIVCHQAVAIDVRKGWSIRG